MKKNITILIIFLIAFILPITTLHAEKTIGQIENELNEKQKKLDENKALIKKISDYANELPEIISKQKAKVEFYTKQFEQAKADIIPYFDKLKNYFNSRGIKVIR